MKQYVAIVKVTGSVVDKIQDFDSQAEAEAHVIEYGGFVVNDPGGSPNYWIADPVAKTAVLAQGRVDSDRAMREWKRDMHGTDSSLPRWFEDAIDDGSIILKSGRVKDSYDAKKEVRARQP